MRIDKEQTNALDQTMAVNLVAAVSNLFESSQIDALIFEDYNTPQLFEIAETLIEEEDLGFDDAAKIHIIKYIDKLVKTKHKYFGNARTIRKIVAQAVHKQHLRMAQLSPDERTEKVINLVTFEDVSEFNLLKTDVKDGIGFNRR